MSSRAERRRHERGGSGPPPRRDPMTSIYIGLGVVIVALFLLLQVVIASLDLTELSAALDYLLAAGLLGLLIIFQPELRRGLMMLGRNSLWTTWSPVKSMRKCRYSSLKTIEFSLMSLRVPIKNGSLGP